ncbi:TNT domain-containing protein [Spirillospora sp. CA-253888]
MPRPGALASALALTVVLLPAPAEAAASRQHAPSPGLCTGAFKNDARLGPRHLPRPWQRPVGPLLVGYHRTGHLTPGAFLAKYWQPEAPGRPAGWKYPPDDGFAKIKGRLDKNRHVLRPGTKLDRFGSEYGGFLAPAGDPYSKRALPPQNLVTRDAAHPCDYHRYRVTRAFTAWRGRIAAWFAQPGGGQQIKLDPALLDPGPGQRLNVQWLLTHKYLVDDNAPAAR